MTTLKERTESKALGLTGNGVGTQSHEKRTETVYCPAHGVVKSYNGHCETCVDEGYRDWDGTRIAKSLIPSWTGINPNGRQVIVAPVKDALEAIQAISRYRGSDAIVLIQWDRVITVLDRDRIGPSYTVQSLDADDSDFVTCARCGQDFRPTFGDERLCDECYLHEHGPHW